MTRDRFALTRRAFGIGALAAAGHAFAQRPAGTTAITPASIVARIQAECARQGISWLSSTVDTFKIGPTDSPVSGIISTFMATLPVMEQAVEKKANFIVSHEPVFYGHFDDVSQLGSDPVYQAKAAFAAKHGLTVWRFHDHWHMIKPEPMSTASIARLGWDAFLDRDSKGFGRTFTRPVLPLSALVEEMARKLPSKSIRVIGDPALPVSRIVSIGHNVDGVVRAFAIGDVAICPEIREWDSAEYARDAIATGSKKGLILISHERGEEEGMALCRDWLARLVPERPVTFIDAGDPFHALPRA